MRLTIRCLLAMMTTISNSLDEVVAHLRQESAPEWRGVDSVRRHVSEVRRELAAVLDQMVDTGYGD